MSTLILMAAVTLLIMMVTFLYLTKEDRELARDLRAEQAPQPTPLRPREDLKQAA